MYVAKIDFKIPLELNEHCCYLFFQSISSILNYASVCNSFTQFGYKGQRVPATRELHTQFEQHRARCRNPKQMFAKCTQIWLTILGQTKAKLNKLQFFSKGN